MAFKNIPLTIDTMIRNPEPIEGINQEDNVELNIVVTENKTPKDLSGQTIKVYVRRIDGTLVEQTNQITPTNARKGEVTVKLKNSAFNKEGYALFQLDISDSSGRMTSSYATFKIGKDLVSGEAITNTNEIEALKKVEEYIKKANQELETFKQTVAEINENEATRQENEVVRVKGEASRNKAEAIRVQQEATRKEKENERVRLESIRTTEEADRLKSEVERKEAENNRKVAESNRKLAENTRKTNEAARVEAELNRQSLFEENEEIRNSNENLRIASEKERIKFNSEAKIDELNRKEAEKNRVLAEEERKSSEESRVAAEAIRQNTYTDFNDSEVERKNNEANRVRAEAERVKAESGRNERFNTNEEKRNSTFIESERTRERAFNEAQSNRNEAYEESERVREEAFKVSEAARNEAEEGRVAAELLRVEAEMFRVAGEENRNNTFTQSEEERKATFEEAENNRKVAESKRIEAESVRVEAEKLRVAAETGRVGAENLRVTAEEERAAAETKREEGFNAFEGRISANTEELKNARSATTGEKFDTLDERIDCEVDRLNKKIEVSMLQQEDKENHTIENSVEGLTTDMIIKGRTLQNIIKTETFGNAQMCRYELRDGYYNITELTNPPNKGAMVFDLKLSKKIIPSKTYTCIVYEKPLSNKYLLRDNINSENITSVISGNVFTFTPKKESDFVLLYYYDIVVGDRIKENQNIVILEGDWTNKPVPEYFEGIKSFGETEGNKISILSNGKNMFNLNKFKLNAGSLYGYLELDKTIEKYALSIKEKDSNVDITGVYFGFSANGVDSTNGTTWLVENGIKVKENVIARTFKFISVFPNNKATLDKILKRYYIQLESNSIVTNYESYIEDKKDILLSHYGFDEGLRGFDLTICDKLNDIRGVAIKKIEKHIFNATEVWQKTSVGVGSDVETIRFQTVLNQAKDSNKFIANFPTLGVSTWDTDKENMQVSKGVFYVRIKKNKLETQDVNGFVKWLKSNPITVYYELAEPIETPLVENINLKTFDEKTYVSFENAISGTSNFKAPVNAASTISHLNRENRALKEENKTLKQDFESTTLSLTDSDLELVKQNVDMDFRLMEVEFALDIPQSTLSSKFKKKGEVKSMARTPYQMLKIVILSGDYDREDYIHKVGKYYERGRMTKEEYDELMSLMTADEVIGG